MPFEVIRLEGDRLNLTPIISLLAYARAFNVESERSNNFNCASIITAKHPGASWPFTSRAYIRPCFSEAARQ